MIHVLPTDKPSRLHFTEFFEELVFTPKYEKLDGVNICITSDEEIKPSDYYLWKNKEVIKANDIQVSFHPSVINDCKKIILTTDQDLIKDGVQAIDDEFLEWFVKNPSCEEVKVEEKYNFEQVVAKRKNPLNGIYYSYKIIIPKEEPKQETLEEIKQSYFKNGFKEGAKWQAERMYSEEDMRTAWNSSEQNMRFNFSSSVYKSITFEQWLEQFKKE